MKNGKARATQRSRRLSASIGAMVLTAGLTVGGGGHVAQAQPVSSSAPVDIQAFLAQAGGNAGSSVDQFNSDLRNHAWNFRKGVSSQVSAVLNEAQASQIMGIVDGIIEAIFPGLIAEKSAPPAPAPMPETQPEPAPVPTFDNSACDVRAKACVDKGRDLAWLQRDGHVYYGPVSASSGARGGVYETPNGIHHVNRKVKDEISFEFNNAPMPYAVYFTYNGHAFHQGSTTTTSHGCVRMVEQDAARFFGELHIGDAVHVF